MELKVKNDFEVKEGRRIITVPHLEDRASFVHPAFKGTYNNVESQIREVGLMPPTPEQTASLVYSAYENQDNEYSKNIKKIMHTDWLWMFNTVKYVPNKGAFIQKPSESGIEELFVPFGYKIGIQSILEFSENPFVRGLFGEEGVDKIARIADKYKNKPSLYSFKNVGQEIIRRSALGRFWGFGDDRLVVNGWDGYGDGVAFGVCAPEKNK